MIDINLLKNEVDGTYIYKLSDDEMVSYLNNLILNYSQKYNLNISVNEMNLISKTLFSRFRGLGIVDVFLEDKNINEIMINAYNQIFLEINGQMVESEIVFDSNDEYQRIIQKIVSDSGREVNVSNPIVDARLYDGSRVNIILPPISKDDPCVTIRKFVDSYLSIEDLIKSGTLDKEVSKFLEKLIKSKYNIIIGGGTSSGKTTFLNALSEFIDESERIITIEDSRELKLIGKDNLISLESRNSNTSNRGRITIKDLIKNSLRMRPDRIIVGEVRSDETLDMLQAMNTGHDGALTTAHANSTKDMISRLETMVIRASGEIPLEAIKRMISSSIEILIHLKRIDGKERKLVEISEILQGENGESIINRIYEYNYDLDRLVKIGKLINRDKLRRKYAEG